MSKEIYISSTPHETRLAIVEKDELSEIYYERENEYTLAGSIYNGRVTRVLPGMQSAFVDVGLERDAFLYITDFMEEQGESADFDSGGDAKRGGERPERSGERPERSGERPDQGGERRRGERDRIRGREDGREVAAEPLGRQIASESKPVEPEELSSEAETIPAEVEEAGAEGSRRWRGRRGRRRGRGTEGRPGVTTGESLAPAGGAQEDTVFGELSIDLSVQADAEPEALDQEAGQELASGVQEERPREERGRGDRGGQERGRGDRGRDRGGRGRDRDRFGDRGSHGGSVRSSSTEGSAGNHGEATGAPVEPIILPGESLSKYRRDGEGAAEASVIAKPKPSYLTARPSTEIDLSVAGWDGGMTLPGETLSRRRETATPARREQPAAVELQREKDAPQPETEGAAGRGRRRDRDRRRGRGDEAAAAPMRAEESAPVQAFAAMTEDAENVSESALNDGFDEVTEAAAREGTGPEEGTVFGEGTVFEEGTAFGLDVAYEPETDLAPSTDGPSEALLSAVEHLHETVAMAAEPAATVDASLPVEEFHEETTEYEPEEASASYRVDPVSPSEFRQGSAGELAEDEEMLAAGDEARHEFTSLQASGEMLSEPPSEVAGADAAGDAMKTPALTESTHPTSPIEHETAIVSAQTPGQATMAGASATTSEELQSDAAQVFAPGDGMLEEELMDEDEGEVLGMTASFDEDTEEETFEAGAQLGDLGEQITSLARERSLKQLARAEMAHAVEEDEDDFDIDEEEIEEDELEENELGAADSIPVGEYGDGDEDDRLEMAETPFAEDGEKPAAAAMGAFPEFSEEPAATESRPDRGQGRDDGRRNFRRGGGRGNDRGNDRGHGGASDRERGGGRDRDRRGMANARPSSGGRPNRQSVQNTDLPAISDLLKPGQEVLVQIAKEPIAKKGARITSHIALPGRFLVFMPTVNHVGVSRKIESDGERRRLKEILLSERGEASGGFIVRTAALGASEEELRSDLRFLLNLWADIKQRSEASKSPALIYHDLNLVERILRDQVTDNFSAIWVDTETEYERVLRFLQRFQPALMRRVKLYTKDTPLFEQFGISEEINKALRSKVWLKSGGSIVINQTEALVAIDINTGKFVGKTARLEDTIVKTNLDAIPEIVRQIRLRDLGGIIVIDFIDMDDRKNRAKVLAALEEELKSDRAPSKVLQFNDFGLVAITRKRVKQSLERTLSTTCAICAGTGMTKSAITVCNEIYIELRKMHKQLDKGDVMLRVNPEVVKQLKSGSGKWLQEMEEIAGKTILVKSDPSLHPEQFDIH